MTKCSPLLRWPGGKSRLLKEIIFRLPTDFGCLHEPFGGGAALSFALQPGGYFLSDANSELINLYTEVKHRPEKVIRHLNRFPLSPETFVALRRVDRDPLFAKLDRSWRAARYLFLSRTCFNGLLRVDRKGHQSCSLGGPWNEARIFDEQDIWSTHTALRACRLSRVDYVTALRAAQPGDFVYLDPPYVPVRPSGNIAYTRTGFTTDDQGKLANLCGKLTRAGIKWMLSNAATPFIRKLYGHYRIHEIQTRRSLAGSVAARQPAIEYLVTNY